jgi:glycerol uptake facilitator-like aquaporin
MNNFFISLILSAIIAAVALFTNKSENNADQGTYTMKIYVISFITIFGGLSLLKNSSGDIYPEIEIGEADF